MTPLAAPAYTGTSSSGIALAVESMKRHTSDEGHQIMVGLEHAGYKLAGRRLPIDEVNVQKIVEQHNPGIVVVMDKREWDLIPGDFRDRTAAFTHYGILKGREDIFKLTILKDAHQRPPYHMASAAEIGCHAWIVYYDPGRVCALAPYVRPQHVVRTWHSLDAALVPPYTPDGRKGCLLSGAVSSAYPLRQRLVQNARYLPETTYQPHPGYHMRGTATPGFLKQLAGYKVAICTASRYGYALRKLIEATACGCVVITDLPADEVLPGGIDENLVRVPSQASVPDVERVIRQAIASYDPERQRHFAELARVRFDYREIGSRLAADIEAMRRGYCA